MFTVKHCNSLDLVRARYDELFADQWLPVRYALFTWLGRLIEAREGQTILDVACGDGQLGDIARKAGLSYYGVDISIVAAHASHDCRVFVADGAKLPFPSGQFDHVACIGSLEHYLSPEDGLREIARVLKRSGRAYILVPNAYAVTWNALRVWRTGDLADDDRQPIQRFATRRAWERLLAKNNLELCETLGYERAWPRTAAEWEQYYGQPKELALAALAPFLPLNMMRAFLFVCTKGNSE
jgi:SAM-dependent methyltransferase